MEVCARCFSDKELIGFISSSTKIGNCTICGSKNQHLLDLPELFDFFQELLDNFKVSENGMPLSSKIQSNWSFFSSHNVANKILNFVLPSLMTEITSAQINVDYTDDIIENFNHWEILKDELKWKNRFIINIDRLQELGWDGFFNTQFKLNKNIDLYRARLHHKSGADKYGFNEMVCPPREIASAGRANPSGIPCLYLSDNSETVLYEVRASHLDELTVGTFNLKDGKDSINIVDFTEDTFLFQSNSGSINETIKGKLLRQKISNDLSKPMRRYDSELEYIPTQFICEFIKVYTGALGIRFSSSLHPEGNNIVLFDQELIYCKSSKKIRINSVNLKGLTLEK